MPSGDLRKTILIEMQSNAAGVADRAAEEVRRLKGEIASFSDALADGKIGADEFKAGISGATTELRFWGETQRSATAALVEADPEYARYQVRLQEMSSGQNAFATALELTSAAFRTSSQAVVDAIHATE